MPLPAEKSRGIRFGLFEVDLQEAELRKGGIRVKLQEQPFQTLIMLLERPGETVTREELRQKLWPADTFVDFDHNLNSSINKLREALGDNSDNPRFIETLHRRGYRFIAPVDGVRAPVEDPVQAVPVGETPVPSNAKWPYVNVIGVGLAILLSLAALLIALNVGHWRDQLLGRPTTPRIKSLAVLPLKNLSGDPQQDYFADGMTDALISEVGQIGSLRVISHTSVMQYKGTRKPLPQIARELNVDALVEGSVLRSAARVRVTAQLIGAVPERHLWARSYDRDLRDVLTLESEVARAIAEEVKTKVTPDVLARLSHARPVNPEAHELFLKGISRLSRQNGVSDLKQAQEYLRQSIQKDPNSAQPYLGVAWTYIELGDENQMASNQAYPIAKDYARKALELDDSLADAHVALAVSLEYGDWNWSGAEAEYKRAFEVNPNWASAYVHYAELLVFIGRMEEAIAEGKRFQQLSPVVPWPYNTLASAYYFDRRYDEALAQIKMAEEITPDCCKMVHSIMRGWIYREKGMYKESFVELQKFNPPVVRLGHVGNAYARAGKKAEAQNAIQELLEFTKQGLGNWEVALVYAGLGEKDQAFEWLERAYKAHDRGMCYLKIDPPLDPLRSDPRFQDLVRRMNFPQ